MQPTLAGFIDFVRTIMGIAVGVLPDSSPYFQLAYDDAIATVNIALAGVPSPSTSPSIYARAVYNFAGDWLVNNAQDAPDAPLYKDGLPFFAYMRKTLDLTGFIGGVIQSAADESTSESMVIQDAAKLFTLGDVQMLKTPWGRAYLSIAQKYGYLVGLT